MGTSRRDDHEAVLHRVRALLAKAESTTFPEEAEALTAKAQELVSRHAIDRALLDLEAGGAPGRATHRRITISDPYVGPKALLLAGIAEANRCRAVWSSTGYAEVFGFDDDLDAVELLWVSVLTHAVAALARQGRGDAAARTRSFRRAFFIAFAGRVRERLDEVRRRAEAEAAATHGERLLPALAARDGAVDEALRAAHPRTRRSRFSVGDAAGWHAGRSAAEQADLGTAPSLR